MTWGVDCGAYAVQVTSAKRLMFFSLIFEHEASGVAHLISTPEFVPLSIQTGFLDPTELG